MLLVSPILLTGYYILRHHVKPGCIVIYWFTSYKPCDDPTSHDKPAVRNRNPVKRCRCTLKSHFPSTHVGTSLCGCVCECVCVSTDSSNDCIIHAANLKPVSTLSDQQNFLYYSFLLQFSAKITRYLSQYGLYVCPFSIVFTTGIEAAFWGA